MVVTVCDNAKEACPTLPGAKQILHWPFEDPADADTAPNYIDQDSDGDSVGNASDDVDEFGYSSLDADNDGEIDSVVDLDTDGIMDTVEGMISSMSSF